MAKQIITKILDDIDGGEADETLSFALDGYGYEIDLSSRNSKKLRDFMETYIEAAQRTGRVGSGPQLQKHKPAVHTLQFAADREKNQAIREWAKASGLEVSERGRIPEHVRDAYRARDDAKSVVAAVKSAANVPEVAFKPEPRPRNRVRAS